MEWFQTVLNVYKSISQDNFAVQCNSSETLSCLRCTVELCATGKSVWLEPVISNVLSQEYWRPQIWQKVYKKKFIKVWQKFIKSLPCCKQTLCRQIMSYYQYHFMRKLWKSLILKGTVITSYLPPCTWALDTFQLHLFEEAASEEGTQTGQSYLRGWILVYTSIPYQYNNFSLTCV